MKPISWALALVVLCSLALPASAVAQSPRIAYAIQDREQKGYPAGIWVMDGEGNSQRLTEATHDSDPTWSPDKEHIAFLRYGRTQTAPGVEHEGYNLWIMDADGTDLVMIDRAGPGSFDWSPDGSRLVFATGLDLWTVAPDGTNRLQLTNDVGSDYEPDWSPDGDTIAYTCEGEICVIDSDGGAEVKLTEDPTDSGSDYNPQWSPDNGSIAFATTRDVPENEDGPYHNDLMVMDHDGTNERRLTDDCHSEYELLWTVDSRRVVYGTFEGADSCSAQHDSEVRIVNIEGKPTSRNITNNRLEDYYPDLSPNGRWIIFTRMTHTNQSIPRMELKKMTLDGTRSVLLTFTPRRPEQDPDW